MNVGESAGKLFQLVGVGLFLVAMASIRLEDRLEGISNYLPWKARIIALLKENRPWSFVDTVVQVLQNNRVDLAAYEVKQARTQRFLLDGVRDALIPHIAEKATSHEMWGTLKNLFEAKNENKKMALKEKLLGLKMLKEESVVSFLTRVTQIKDEFVAVREIVAESKVVRIALRGVAAVSKD